MRCPECNQFKVIAVAFAGIYRYRCDVCDKYIANPIETKILVTGTTFKVLT